MTNSGAADEMASPADSRAQGDSSPARVTAPDTVLERLEALRKRRDSTTDVIVAAAADSSMRQLAYEYAPDLLAVAKAAYRAKVYLFDSPLEGSLDRYEEVSEALAPLLREAE
jgi:hypothetical protein